MNVQTKVSTILHETLLCYRSMATSGVDFRAALCNRLPAMITLDYVRIKQMLSNGVTNALKNTNSGSVCVQVHLVRPTKGQPLPLQPTQRGSTASMPTTTAPGTPHHPPASAFDSNDIASLGLTHVLFQVIDTGKGLRGIDHKTLFDPSGTEGNGCTV